MANNNSSIKDLALKLKNRKSVQPDPPVETKQPVDGQKSVKNQQVVEVKSKFSKKVEELNQLIQQVNNQNQYQISEIIHIDKEVHEVCKRLKSVSKLRISLLASYLLEQFIKENIEAIQELTSREENKYLKNS